jgi:hypothetical protein
MLIKPHRKARNFNTFTQDRTDPSQAFGKGTTNEME